MKPILAIILALSTAVYSDQEELSTLFLLGNNPIAEESEPLFEIIDFNEESDFPEIVEIDAPIPPLEEAVALSPRLEKETPLVQKEDETSLEADEEFFSTKIDFQRVFGGSPIIYTLLFLMSILALFIWLYSQIHLRILSKTPQGLLKTLRDKLNSNQYEEALALCQQHENLFCKMLFSGIYARASGWQVILENMKAEGKRGSVKFWQRISLLNDIAIIAPMLGLLGTVLGMFYAFYDINRSVESVSALFDGLGISVGTTVAGLIVAIIAMMLYSVSRYRLVRRLAFIESEAHSYAAMINSKTPHSGQNL
jgi:biopolymer transport protein ExbB